MAGHVTPPKSWQPWPPWQLWLPLAGPVKNFMLMATRRFALNPLAPWVWVVVCVLVCWCGWECECVRLYLWQRVSVRNRSLSQRFSVAPLWRGQGSLFPLAVPFANFIPPGAHATNVLVLSSFSTRREIALIKDIL